MRVIAKVEGQHPKLVKALLKVGIVAEQKPGEVIISLHKKDAETFKIPAFREEMEKAKYQIAVSEYGGNGGRKAMVVCARDGKALQPYYIPRFRRPNGEHALYALSGSFTTIKALPNRTLVEIRTRELSIDTQNDTASIKSVVLWSGKAQDLPESLSHYRDAVLAAHEKAQCPDCWHIHYAQKGSHPRIYRTWDEFVKVQTTTEVYRRIKPQTNVKSEVIVCTVASA